VIQLPDRTYTISLLTGAATHAAYRQVCSLEDFLAALQTYEERAHKDGGAWSPITWGPCNDPDCDELDAGEHDARLDTHALAVCALVFDLDHESDDPKSGPPTDDQLAALGEALERKGWIYALHETFTAGRYRLILPLSRDLKPSEYAGIWEAARHELGVVADPLKDLGRLFYSPARPIGQERTHGTGGTALLDPSSLTPRAQPARAAQNRNSTGNHVQNFDSPAVSAPIDLDPIRAAVSNLKADVRKPLLEALAFKLRLPKGARETPLHVLTSNLTTVLPQKEMVAAWDVCKLVFGHVIEKMDDPTLTRDEYLAKVRYSFERAWDLREKKREHRQAAISFFTPAEGSPEAWRGDLLTTISKDGEPHVKACTYNLDIILERHPAFRGFVRWNTLRRRVEITGGELQSKTSGTTALALSNWLQSSEFSMFVDRQICGAAILHAAKRHPYNPVKEYLEPLVWDGQQRLDRVLLDLCDAQGNEEYIADISRKFFIAAAARALNPGCKVDTVLVLQGIQGTRKTSFVECLAGDWYTTVNTIIRDKDTQMQATEAWFVELSELASSTHSTISSLRGYLTKRVDQIRVPYAESHEDYPRHCVFVGTTNDDQPLIDPDGNRRYWVVACGEIDIEQLKQHRDQIWAEAVHLYRQAQKDIDAGVDEEKMTCRWWMTRAEQNLADRENDVFQVENPLEDDIKIWLKKPSEKPAFITPTQVAKLVLRLSNERLADSDHILVRIGKTLKKLGWKKVRRGTSEARFWAYEVPKEAA
jgi:predicted P-loop ATPase